MTTPKDRCRIVITRNDDTGVYTAEFFDIDGIAGGAWSAWSAEVAIGMLYEAYALSGGIPLSRFEVTVERRDHA